VLVNTRLLALVAAHDSVAADTDKLEAAAEVYRDLLSSVSGTADGGGGAASYSSAVQGYQPQPAQHMIGSLDCVCCHDWQP
jgi:hypothetical protein